MTTMLDTINWQRVGRFELTVPKELSPSYDKISGQLYLSRRGYMYATVSKPVVWLKFLGLALALPFVGVAKKIGELVQRCFGEHACSKGLHDLKHTFHLAGIAFKAVITGSIFERVEEFALAELDYNSKSREQELDKPRSYRFEEGVYVARCMQPLFHEKQYMAPKLASDKLAALQGEHKQLQAKQPRLIKLQKTLQRVLAAKEALPPATEPVEKASCLRQGGILEGLYHTVSSLASYVLPVSDEEKYKDCSLEEIAEELQHVGVDLLEVERDLLAVQNKIDGTELLIHLAKRCQKYAVHAIFKQQCVPKGEVVDECKVCDQTCYRHEQICGLVHKVDCCATRCWALDCFFCICCFWPEGRHCCMIS